MSDIKKFAYTTGGLFTLTGSDYIGYYNIKDNAAFVGKYTQNTSLTNNESIQTTIAISDKFYNRIATENITLKYTLSDFVFEPGEYINTNSINLKIEKAFSNYLDTYRGCFIATSKLPYFYTGLARVSATNTGKALPIWNYSSANTYMSAFSAYNSAITRDSKIAYIPNQYASDPNNHTLVVANLSSLMVFLVNRPLYTFNVVFSSTRIETNNTAGYNQLQFSNICSIAKAGNSLYVVDSNNKAVYAYDITSTLQEDRALGNRFSLTNSIDKQQGKFDTPLLVAASEDRIFVYDDVGIIHFYDRNFNAINSYKNRPLFIESVPVSMTYYKLYDQLFVLTSDFKLVVLDSEANSTIYTLDTTGFLYDEVPKKIVFSNSNSDIFYMLTNKSLYKKFVSNIYRNIGNYSFVNNITGIAGTYPDGTNLFSYLYDIDTYDSINNYDNLLIYGYDQFLSYNEKTLFDTILK